MKITRKKDQISFSDENGGGAISAMKMEKTFDDEVVQGWIKYCAKLVAPNPRTFAEVEQYLMAHYDVKPLAPDDFQMRHFKANVLISRYAHQLKHIPPEFLFDMTDEEIEYWHYESDAQRQEALSTPPERFNLQLRGYQLLSTERNHPLIEAGRRIWERHTGKKYYETQASETFVFWEETTNTFTASGMACYPLMIELGTFWGVTQEDINGLTPRFLGYIHGLAEKGKLPSLKEFAGSHHQKA